MYVKVKGQKWSRRRSTKGNIEAKRGRCRDERREKQATVPEHGSIPEKKGRSSRGRK